MKVADKNEELSEVFYMDYEALKEKIKCADPEVAIVWSAKVEKLFNELDKIVY